MNMLPINSEWKRRIKWTDKQRKLQQQASKPSRQAVVKTLVEPGLKTSPGSDD